MVAIGRPSVARLALFQRGVLLDRAAGDLPALLLVLTPIAVLNVLVGSRPTGVPGPAEMDAVVGASTGGTGAVTADVGFLGQLAVAQALAAAAWDSSLLQSARGLCLLAGLLTAALLWPVLRRSGLHTNAAATAVLVAGLGPLALRLQPSVDAGAVAGFWIALAAAIGFRVRLGATGMVAVIAALAVAVVTTPVAAAGLLAALAHALGAAILAPRLRPVPRIVLAAVAALGAGAAATTALASAAGGRGAVALPVLTLLALFVLGAVVLIRAWERRPELRVVVTMVAAWLGCATVPGPARLTALQLAVPALALLIGGLIGVATAQQWPRFSVAAATAVTVAMVSGIVTVLWPVAPPRPSSYQPLAGWLTSELEPDAVLSAAPLDRAELVAAGVPAQRFAAGSVPAGAVTVVPAEAGCGDVGVPAVQMATAAGSLGVCAPAAGDSDAMSAGFGQVLVRNPEVSMTDPARQLLERGRVDGRLVTVLAGAAMEHPISVAGFPAIPGEPDTAVRRTAVLDGVVRAVDVNGRPAASALELYLNAQQPSLRPDLRTLADGRLIVHLRLPTAG